MAGPIQYFVYSENDRENTFWAHDRVNARYVRNTEPMTKEEFLTAVHELATGVYRYTVTMENGHLSFPHILEIGYSILFIDKSGIVQDTAVQDDTVQDDDEPDPAPGAPDVEDVDTPAE